MPSSEFYAGMTVLPNLLVVGAQRCGTSSINHYLRQHPDVFMAPGKELHFFDDHFDRGLDWYESRFRGAEIARVVGEASPRYMYKREAVERMAALLPTARLVAILRNPVDRAYSHYWMAVARDREHRSFEEAVDAELSRAGPTTTYLDQGRYLHQLRHLSDRLPRAPLHIMITEQLANEPVDAFSGLCRFLDVDPTFLPADLGTAVNRYVEFRSATVRRMIRAVPDRRLRRVLGVANVRRVDYRPLDPATRAMLMDLYDVEKAALSDHLRTDLSRWWW